MKFHRVEYPRYVPAAFKGLYAASTALHEGGLGHELLVPLRGVIRWVIIAATILLILERLGMSATVLWTAFTGLSAVATRSFRTSGVRSLLPSLTKTNS